MSQDQQSYLKSTLFISICSFLSNILGLFRNTLFSAIYGATSGEGLADCYIASFSIPNIIYNLVAAGLIAIILIPYFISVQQKTDFKTLNRVCSGFINLFFIIISFCISLAAIFMPFLVRQFLVSGWTNEHNINLVISMSRIILLQVLLFTLSSVFGSYLNALEKFTAYSLAILFYNVGIILGVLVLDRFLGIEGVAWGVVLGALFHLGIQLLGAIRNGFRYSLVLPKPDPELNRLALNALPRIFTLSSSQFIRFFFVNFASFLLTGSILIYDNVESIALIPYTLLAVSISTTAFPIFIKHYQQGNYQELYRTLFEKLNLLLFFLLPILCFIAIFRLELISLLIGYGKYNAYDISLTAEALFYFILGTPAFALILVIVKFYYAEGKTLLPMLIALLALLITVGLSYFLAPLMGVAGLALGRSIGNLCQAFLLLLFIFVKNRYKQEAQLSFKKPAFNALKTLLLCIPFSLLAWLGEQYLVFPLSSKFNDVLKLGLTFLILAPSFIFVALLTKIPEAQFILSLILKKNKT